MKKWLVVLTIVSIFMGSQKVVKAVAVTGACQWCGATCQRTTVGQRCMDVAPPTGKICVEENGACVALSTIALPTVPEEKAVGGEAYLYLKSVNTVDVATQNYDLVDLGMEANTTVGGVDMVQFGPADYSMSIDLPGQWDHPKVRAAEKTIIETALKMGVRPRIELFDFEAAKPYIDMGVRDFCIGWDVLTVHQYCKKHGEGLVKLLGR